MNKVILVGNLTKNITLQHTESGIVFTRFTVACNNGKDKDGNQREADFVPCTLYGKQAINLEKYKKKGDTVTVEGKWRSFNYEKDGETIYGNECLVSNVEYVGSSKKDSDEPELSNEPEKPVEEFIEIEDGDFIRF